MLNKFHEKQQGMELIILEQLVPQDHLLRKIDRSIDFSFIRRLCAPLYSANLGRPAIEPFCGLSLTEKAPDATTLSVNRKRRFRDNNIPEQIFNEILRQAMEKGLVGGTILYTDSTHVKAKANKHKKTTVVVERTPKAYLEELDEAIERDRKELGKKPFSIRRMTMIRLRHGRSSRAKATRKADSCTRRGSRTASITASTGPWTASTTLW